jgi:hypothetical protein
VQKLTTVLHETHGHEPWTYNVVNCTLSWKIGAHKSTDTRSNLQTFGFVTVGNLFAYRIPISGTPLFSVWRDKPSLSAMWAGITWGFTLLADVNIWQTRVYPKCTAHNPLLEVQYPLITFASILRDFMFFSFFTFINNICQHLPKFVLHIIITLPLFCNEQVRVQKIEMYKTVILSADMYGRETRSLSLNEGVWRQVVRTKFGPTEGENGNKYIPNNFTICSFRQILSLWSNQEGWNKLVM